MHTLVNSLRVSYSTKFLFLKYALCTINGFSYILFAKFSDKLFKRCYNNCVYIFEVKGVMYICWVL